MDALWDAQEWMTKDLLATKISCKEELLSELQTMQSAPLHDTTVTPALISSASFSDTGVFETSGGRTPRHRWPNLYPMMGSLCGKHTNCSLKCWPN